MIDYARITVKAGDGGNGSGSFHRIKGKRYGKADGGDGGGGGHVYIEATFDLNTLEKYRFVKDYRAGNGGNGLSNHRRGAQGEDLILRVPVGTEIQLSVFGSQLSEKRYSVGQSVSNTPGVSQGVAKRTPGVSEETDKQKTAKLQSDNRQQGTDNCKTEVYDLTEPGERVLVARGGEGGRGNAHLRDEFGRRPRVGETGQEGEQVNLTLELKLIADVGLIGLPNSGKSTLLSKLTAAKPAIAAYPFTTLEPNLGVMQLSVLGFQLSDRRQPVNQLVGSETDKPKTERLSSENRQQKTDNRRLVIADIPGLIEGSSQGRGLGDLFLRHIERTRILVHLVDGAGSVDVWKDYQTVRNELSIYSKELSGKKEIVAVNKIDQMSEPAKEKAREEFKKHRKKIFFISAKLNMGLEEVLGEIFKNIA